MTIAHFTLPPLGYAYDALDPVYSAELLELHYAGHHRAYVKGANHALEALAEMRARGDFRHINELEKDLAFNLSGHVLHSIFWRNIEPKDGVRPSGRLESCIRASFGSFDALRQQFGAAGMALQGAGWVALTWESIQGRLLVEQVHEHQGNCCAGTLPLLVMDMWEHAYYLQYSNRKQLWTVSFWDLINWGDVAQRLEKAESADIGLGQAVRHRTRDVVTPFRRDRPQS